MRLNSIKQTFSVNYSYQLFFTKGIFNSENPLFFDVIKQNGIEGSVKLIFVLDEGVVKNHAFLIESIREYASKFQDDIDLRKIIVIEGGEQSKNRNHNVQSILKAINDNHICRHSFVVVLGGGAIIDMVGYAATIAHRGVNLIRIPTTVLAQNDAAVGVKNSVNAFNKKNFIGTFSVPFAIINDLDFLNTLNQRDWISGVAEALKVALINDIDFFYFIEKNANGLANRELSAMAPLIHRCAEIHMSHIGKGGDPFERGSSRPLDFGHWAAHRLEQMTDYTLRHGEAVAMGITLDLTYAFLMNYIKKQDLERILKVFREIGFDLNLPIKSAQEVNILLEGIEEFREHLGGKLTITLIDGIGSKYDVHQINLKKMRKAITMRSTSNTIAF